MTIDSYYSIVELFSTFDEPVFYLTNDPFKAIGLEKIIPNYHIVCIDQNPVIKQLKKGGVRVFCLEEEVGERNVIPRSSKLLYKHPLTQQYLIEHSPKSRHCNLVFFKPTFDPLKSAPPRLQGRIRVLGNSVELNKEFEDKISFFSKALDLKLPVPRGVIGRFKSFHFADLRRQYGAPVVVQFRRGWAGNRTFFVREKEEFDKLKARFASQEAKVTEFIKGITLTNNACVTRQGVLVSAPFLQITGVKELVSYPGASCGNQWGVRVEPKIQEKILLLTKKIGEVMRAFGYLGFFGLDFLIEDSTGRVYIGENNARLTASVPFFTQLEILHKFPPLLAFHLLEFLSLRFKIESRSLNERYQEGFRGGRLVVRNSHGKPIKIASIMPSGTYTLKLEKVEEGYRLESIKKNTFLLLLPGPGRRVNPDQEIFHLQSLDLLVSSEGEIKSDILKMIRKIKGKLNPISMR